VEKAKIVISNKLEDQTIAIDPNMLALLNEFKAKSKAR